MGWIYDLLQKYINDYYAFANSSITFYYVIEVHFQELRERNNLKIYFQ